MALYFKIEGSNIVFFGDTFNHRPSIKELGARFNGASKTWIVTDTPEMRDRAALIAQFNGAKTQKPAKLTEDQFRFDHNQDAMATEKLAEGIRNFVIDQNKLETALSAKL